MTDTADQVPSLFDVIIDGHGYVTARAVDPNLPFRVQQQMLSYSPTFVERQNVSNAYGDNAFDFFLNIRQRDWSLGEQQRFFRVGADGRYYAGSNVDVSTPGQVRLAQSHTSVTFAAAVSACARDTNGQKLITASATKLYTIDSAGTITDNGAHGLGATPSKFGLACDGAANYVSTTSAGTVGVRKWVGGVYSTFSATAADSLIFNGNTLYGYRAASGDFGRYDTAGTFTTLFAWKGASGVAASGIVDGAVLEAYGGKILILLNYGQIACELWIYDGTGASLLHVFPPNFIGSDIEVLYGTVYISGSFFRAASASTQNNRPAIHFYDGAQIGLLWQANDYGTSVSSDAFAGPHPALVAFAGKLYFTDDTMATLLVYNPASGAVSTIGSYTGGGTDARLAATGYTLLHTRNGTTGYTTGNIAYPSSGFVSASLVDFDSSLPKVFRGVKVEFDAATDGNGGSIDIAYQVDNLLTAGYSALKTGAVSGTEYPGDGTSINFGHAMSIKITLNKGTSTAGPVLKSISLRGAPILPPYRLNEYILDLGGDTSGQNPVVLRDGRTPHPLSGEQMRTNLAAALISQVPVTVTDRTGTYTAMLEPANCEFDITRPSQWLARVRIREV